MSLYIEADLKTPVSGNVNISPISGPRGGGVKLAGLVTVVVSGANWSYLFNLISPKIALATEAHSRYCSLLSASESLSTTTRLAFMAAIINRRSPPIDINVYPLFIDYYS